MQQMDARVPNPVLKGSIRAGFSVLPGTFYLGSQVKALSAWEDGKCGLDFSTPVLWGGFRTVSEVCESKKGVFVNLNLELHPAVPLPHHQKGGPSRRN